ncbi:uncharacterized protein LAESUDRAFT_378160 [Laetiporus sulphureus 93-53]|uniref:Uncharacterized protein n=1 Tax=Laetiporus sulphureus 93-53 TaxID=1314785 RepID=A0A165CQ66_9APHY|nr:uncharacterized protein LAESUDRAFT_378160 [Laetiporus sulphureus 93-53]KZT03220.1 hypothetical protein LAESUDRAFT_378160 [Laetiporus sulphureus 93-53]
MAAAYTCIYSTPVDKLTTGKTGTAVGWKTEKAKKNRDITTSEPALDDWRCDTYEQRRRISWVLAGRRE